MGINTLLCSTVQRLEGGGHGNIAASFQLHPYDAMKNKHSIFMPYYHPVLYEKYCVYGLFIMYYINFILK